MQKSGIVLVISGVLIVTGLVLLVLGNQIILEEVVQENGKVSLDNELVVSNNFEIEDIGMGVFAIQIIDFKDNKLSARIIDPSGIEIVSQVINEEITEEEFEVLSTGIYKLIIDSISNEEIHVFGAVGPVPDAGKKYLGFISIYVLIIGMVGLVLVSIYEIKNRRRSV
ncbi:MAG: hypothetical protein ACPGQP_00635 [Nitrosopumilus sp.]